ncbi:MAG: hypothetical protein WCG29_13660, partial [Desulfomonile sp.]
RGGGHARNKSCFSRVGRRQSTWIPAPDFHRDKFTPAKTGAGMTTRGVGITGKDEASGKGIPSCRA